MKHPRPQCTFSDLSTNEKERMSWGYSVDDQQWGNTGKPLLAMMAVFNLCFWGGGNCTYWAISPNPSFTSGGLDKISSPVAFTNDGPFSAPWSDLGPQTKEGKTVNLTYVSKCSHQFGALCCLCLYPQWWAYCSQVALSVRNVHYPWPLFLIGQNYLSWTNSQLSSI